MTPSSRSAKTVAIALASTTAIQALVTMASLTVSIFAPEAAADIGVAPELIGLYASITYVGAMLGSLIAGGFILRYGAIRFSQAVMLVCAVGLVLCVGAQWWWFLVSAAVFGIGYGPTTPASSHILSRHSPVGALSLVFSIKQTGVPLGGVFAGALVPLLLVYFDWRMVTVIVGVMVITGAIALQAIRRRFDQDRVAGYPLVAGNVVAPLRLVLTRPALRRLAIASFFFSATQQSFIYFLVTYLTVDLDWDVRRAGFALSILGIAAAVGRIGWGAVSDAVGRPRAILAVMALGMAATTAATAAFTNAWPPVAVFVICAAFGATGAAWNGVYLAEITRTVAPHEVASATGAGLFVTFFGVVIAPPLFGLIASLSGSFTLSYCMLALAALSPAVLLVLPRGGVETA